MKVEGIPRSGQLFMLNGGVPEKIQQGRKFFDGISWWKIENGLKIPYTPPTKQQLGLQPTYCPVCHSMMRNRVDAKFWILQQCCYNCAIQKQQKMTQQGTWENYIESKNIRSQISKTKQKIKVLSQVKDGIQKQDKLQFTKNSAGQMENWSIPKDVNNKVLKNIQYYLKQYTQFLQYLVNRLDKLQVKQS